MSDGAGDNYVGARLVALIREDWRAKAALGLIVALVLAGLVTGVVLSQPSATGSTAQASAVPQDPAVLPTACDDPDVATAVEAAIALDSESEANGLLAFPSEVPADDTARQAEAWERLAPDDLEFQLCLHLKQEGVHAPR